jgi:3-methyladenine DNA glycosylase AlkD
MRTGGLAEEIIRRLRETPRDVAAVRSLRKRISKEIAELDRDIVLDAALALISHAPYGRFVGYELVLNHSAMGSISLDEVEALAKGMESWSDVDTFACYISGPAWRKGRIKDSAVREWARSEDRWWRRAALVSTVPLNVAAQGGRGDAKRTLAVCSLLAADRDDMVVKALSWALRSLVKHDPDGVRKFLEDHREIVAARVTREVNHKLSTGLKNPRSKRL